MQKYKRGLNGVGASLHFHILIRCEGTYALDILSSSIKVEFETQPVLIEHRGMNPASFIHVLLRSGDLLPPSLSQKPECNLLPALHSAQLCLFRAPLPPSPLPPCRPSDSTAPPHLQCQRDLGKPRVEPTAELRGTPGPHVQRDVQTLRTRRPALSALR